MRILKFRAFNNNVVGVPFTLEEISTFDIDNSGSSWPEGTVFMQFTGLLDKNGKEIYEGDVCQGNYTGSSSVVHRNKVVWSEAGASFSFAGTALWLWEDFKVIGNIYENPELLN